MGSEVSDRKHSPSEDWPGTHHNLLAKEPVPDLGVTKNPQRRLIGTREFRERNLLNMAVSSNIYKLPSHVLSIYSPSCESTSEDVNWLVCCCTFARLPLHYDAVSVTPTL